jgi:glycerate kinase
MYASVRRYAIEGSAEELARQVREGFAPMLKQGRGFVAYYVVDGGDGTVASMSIFQDRAGAEESNRQAADWVTSHLTQFLPHPPVITAGEVTVISTA